MSSVPDHRADASRTQTLQTCDAVTGRHDVRPLFSLVVQHAGGTQIATLLPGVPLVVGRAPQRGLRIEHTTLSREHARFELVGERVLVVDLDSKNGVLLDAHRVTQAELEVGGAVMLGAVRVQVQALGLTRRVPGIDDEGQFRARV